jgi:hypothetical protein
MYLLVSRELCVRVQNATHTHSTWSYSSFFNASAKAGEGADTAHAHSRRSI